VLVTDTDIRRIVKQTGQEVTDVVRFYKPKEIEWGTDKPGWINFKSGKRILGLRRTKRGCQYLGEDDLCTIYDHRPITCRRYPFNVELDEGGDVEFLSISDSVDCPYELDGHNTPGQIKALCNWEDKEETPYNEKVNAWNRTRKIGGKTKFLKHLGF
jgi:Fe-S-cluster containining protein